MKKINILLLSLLLIFTCSLGVEAKNDTEISKDETVYINLQDNGSVKEVLVVNHIYTPQAGTYVDYGDYAAIENITGKEVPTVEGDKITWELPQYEDGFYYIGTLKTAELPWNFGITYFLDNKRVEPEELSGADGNVKLKIVATANDKAEKYFQDNFAMQLSLSLNTDICKNINAPDATTVLAGKTMTVSYTALPGSDVNTTISFDAKDLELSGLSLIFSPFSMDGSLGELEDGVSAMLDAMSALISGTQKLQAGMTQLSDGAGELSAGSRDLVQGAGDLDEGLNQYEQGLTTFSNYIASFSAEMSKSLTALEDAGKQLESAKGALKQSNQKIEGALAALDSMAQDYAGNISQLEDGLNGLSGGLQGLSDGMADLIAANAAIEENLKTIQGQYAGLQSQYASLGSQLNSSISSEAKALANSILASESESEAAKNLANAYLKTAGGIDQASQGLSALNDNFKSLNNSFAGAITNIASGYNELNSGLTDMKSSVNTMLQSLGSGFDFSAIKNQLLTMQKELNNVSGVLSQFDISDFNIDVSQYKSGIKEMQGAVNSLQDNFIALHEGISGGLISGLSELNSGIDLLYENLKSLPAYAGDIAQGQRQLRDGMDDALGEFSSGETTDLVSFAAPGKLIPRTVQFIGTTPGVAADNTVYVAPDIEKPTLWQRIKNLFG